jgi:hypothetical protein
MVLKLQADATYSSLVNTLSTVPVGAMNTQVYPIVVYHQGTVIDLNDFDGATGNRTARVQFDAYSALSYDESKAVVKAIRDVFKNLNNVTLSDADATFVQQFQITQESDMTMVPQGKTKLEYRVMVEVTANYIES